MIIKQIKSIKNFCIYQDFKWNEATPDFSTRNIIYGWNYSGKTTLSRFIEMLPSMTDDQAKEIGFKICVQEGQSQSEQDGSISGLSVFVFNSEYIDNNLHFNTENHKIKGLLFDIGEETTEKREQIINIKKRIDSISEWIETNHNDIDNYNNLEKLFTKAAKSIKNETFESSIEFTKSHFKKILGQLTPANVSQYIIGDTQKLSTIRANALTKAPLAQITYTPIKIDLIQITEDVNRVLSFHPQKTTTDYLLNSNQFLYEWGKQGLNFYKKNREISVCAFCGNKIEADRIAELNRFYSNEAAQLIERIKELTNNINTHISILNNQKNLIVSQNDLIESCRFDYSEFKSKYMLLIPKIVDFLERLRLALNSKEISLFEPTNTIAIPNTLNQDYELLVNNIIHIIQLNNKTISNFNSIKVNAIEALKFHSVATIVRDIKFFQLKRQKERQENLRSEKNLEIRTLQSQYDTIKSEIKSITKGQEILNKYIQTFLNRSDLKIHTTQDDYFVLKRGDRLATHLSEGEKTAIALSYFFVTLLGLKDDGELDKSIIFIDDPISSLDNNHIAQVSSLINSFFFTKNGEKVKEHFAQLFISTHNFEFFSFLRDAKNFKGKKKSNLYYLDRTNENVVKLLTLPKVLSDYNSEYLFLFAKIYYYYSSGYPLDESYNMPNIIRRFLEIYTLIKLPGNKENLDTRIKDLIGDSINELKILHNFSHFTSLERVTKHSEIILRLPDIVNDVITLLKKDPMHFNSLKQGVNEQLD